MADRAVRRSANSRKALSSWAGRSERRVCSAPCSSCHAAPQPSQCTVERWVSRSRAAGPSTAASDVGSALTQPTSRHIRRRPMCGPACRTRRPRISTPASMSGTVARLYDSRRNSCWSCRLKNATPGTNATPAARACAASSTVSTPGTSSQQKNPPVRLGPGHRLRHVLGQRGVHGRPALAVEVALELDLRAEVPAPQVLLDHPLAERARALVGVLLGHGELLDDLGRAGGPPQPYAGEEGLGEGAQLHDHVGRQGVQAGQPLVGEAQLAVGDVLGDQDLVRAAQLDQCLPALQRHGAAGRVLVLRDRVEHLGHLAPLDQLGEPVDDQAVLVDRHALHDRVLPGEAGDRADVARLLDHDEVARVEHAAGDQRHRVDAAAGDHQLAAARAAARRSRTGGRRWPRGWWRCPRSRRTAGPPPGRRGSGRPRWSRARRRGRPPARGSRRRS